MRLILSLATTFVLLIIDNQLIHAQQKDQNLQQGQEVEGSQSTTKTAAEIYRKLNSVRSKLDTVPKQTRDRVLEDIQILEKDIEEKLVARIQQKNDKIERLTTALKESQSNLAAMGDERNKSSTKKKEKGVPITWFDRLLQIFPVVLFFSGAGIYIWRKKTILTSLDNWRDTISTDVKKFVLERFTELEGHSDAKLTEIQIKIDIVKSDLEGEIRNIESLLQKYSKPPKLDLSDVVTNMEKIKIDIQNLPVVSPIKMAEIVREELKTEEEQRVERKRTALTLQIQKEIQSLNESYSTVITVAEAVQQIFLATQESQSLSTLEFLSPYAEVARQLQQLRQDASHKTIEEEEGFKEQKQLFQKRRNELEELAAKLLGTDSVLRKKFASFLREQFPFRNLPADKLQQFKDVLGIEDIELFPETEAKNWNEFEVDKTNGSGPRAIIEAIIAPGYRERKTRQILAKAKVHLRLEN